MDNNLLSTKFLYAVLVTILGFVLTIMGNVPADLFFNFCELIGSIYVLGNVVQKFAPTVKA